MSSATTKEGGEPTRRVLTRLNEDGSYTAQSVTSSTNFKIRAECLLPSRLVVPIIFVPGTMGTRLKVKDLSKTAAWFPLEKSVAWSPPEGTWEKLLVFLRGLHQSASDRQRVLDPGNTDVDDNGVSRPDPEIAKLLGDAPGDTDAERSKWRGWGQLHGDSYGEILGLLEKRLAEMMENGENKQPQWQDAVMKWQSAEKLGAQKAFTALDDDAVKLAASVFYPVHAVGYNWLESNGKSAKRLAAEIQRILDHYTDCKKVAEKVIIVTHSMGGLVARACLLEPGMQDKILGIVHGVMPALGAPAAYKRMRAGFEGPEQVVLGRNAADCTAVLSLSAGVLELLPTRQYKAKAPDGTLRHWLRASYPLKDRVRHAERASVELGDAADACSSIYLNNDQQNWWRMVRAELVDPAGKEDREKAKQDGDEPADENGKASDFPKYVKVMKVAKALQDSIEDRYHPNTYAYYAADAKQPSWNEVHWKADEPVQGDLRVASIADDDLNGRVTAQLPQRTHSFELEKAQGLGDGTVPEESGSAPTPHVVQIFRHEGSATGHASYEHQFSYKADVVQAVTLYSISRIVADSDWLKSNLHKA